MILMAENIHHSRVKCTDHAPFFDGAKVLWDAGLCPVPCLGDDGKTPNAYAWGKWTMRPGADFLATMIQKHSTANVGILTGPLSGVTIVDIDDPELVPAMQERFGDTPIITRTPSGGVHLWYRWNGEGCPTHLRRIEGLKVDIKGKGGFSVEPPSFRPSDGTQYYFDRGNLADLPNLPTIKDDSLNTPTRRTETPTATRPATAYEDPEIGTRDEILFAYARLITLGYFPHDRDGLIAAVAAKNAGFNSPLPERQAIQKAEQAWKYAEQGTLMAPGCEPAIIIPRSLIDEYADDPQAFWFRCYLNSRHGAEPGKTFAITPKAIAGTLPRNWSHPTVQKTRDRLIERGALEQVRKGKRICLPDGTWKQEPNLFSLVQEKASIHRGNDPLPNITIHPSPSFPPIEEGDLAEVILLPVAQPDFFNPDVLKVNLAHLRFWAHGDIPDPIQKAIINEMRRRGLRHADLAHLAGISRPQLTNSLLGRFGLGRDATERIKEWLLAA